MTFLGGQESSRSLYAIPGLDYVAHEDILPYVSAERSPVQHELFDKFLTHCPEQGETSQTYVMIMTTELKVKLSKEQNNVCTYKKSSVIISTV